MIFASGRASAASSADPTSPHLVANLGRARSRRKAPSNSSAVRHQPPSVPSPGCPRPRAAFAPHLAAAPRTKTASRRPDPDPTAHQGEKSGRRRWRRKSAAVPLPLPPRETCPHVGLLGRCRAGSVQASKAEAAEGAQDHTLTLRRREPLAHPVRPVASSRGGSRSPWPEPPPGRGEGGTGVGRRSCRGEPDFVGPPRPLRTDCRSFRGSPCGGRAVLGSGSDGYFDGVGRALSLCPR